MAIQDVLPLLSDTERGTRNLDSLAAFVGADADGVFARALRDVLADVADADMALNNLVRLSTRADAHQSLREILTDTPPRFGPLVHLLAASQFFADTLGLYPDALDIVEAVPRQNPSPYELVDMLKTEVARAEDDGGVLRAFRRYRHLQLLRVGVNDILRDRPLEEVIRDLARVADAAVEVALATAFETIRRKYGTPMTGEGGQARVVVLAFGKLGGDELNYSSDIDLMIVYDQDGYVSGPRQGRMTNAQFFARVVTELVRLLSSHTDRGFAYRIDLRLRPEGNRGPLARSLPATLSYYDVMGRTWERQALIKLRPCAGDFDLGNEFVRAIEPFVYRKYFSFSEINEVKALKRQMEARATRSGTDDLDVKTGHGGIRDIEYTVQFLQLLNGGDLPAVRQRNTLLALESLEIAGCLTAQETYILADAYRFLRKIEHRLQLMFDWQTHKLPTDAGELAMLARRMGYADLEKGPPGIALRPDAVPVTSDPTQSPQKRSPLDETPNITLDTRVLLIDSLDQFLKDVHDKTEVNRAILDHLLHMTFAEADDQSEPESDLILLSEPDTEAIATALAHYDFADPIAAYRNLMNLARESVPFLSHRRCRHFLASIAPQLLRAIADTPDPDNALNSLERVTASLGAKAVLYELFSFNEASLKLYVDLCASSPYLSGILINNPGMIDELLDSLVLDQPRTRAELAAELAELLRGATDPDPILHSFQDKELLRIGVRDLLGRDDIRETTAALSDLAETILCSVFELAEKEINERWAGGDPNCRTPELFPRYAVVGLGKFGGGELTYHSDLDLMVLYDSKIDAGQGAYYRTGNSTNASKIATKLVQLAIARLGTPGPLGRLYSVDMRLRPTGKSGSLAGTLPEFRRYYDTGGGETWERLALTKARVLCGDTEYADLVYQEIDTILKTSTERVTADEVQRMRSKLEFMAKPSNLKRGYGGLVDLEFVVQLLQIRYPEIRTSRQRTDFWSVVDQLAAAGHISQTNHDVFTSSYSFTRRIESRLRLMTDSATSELPESEHDMDMLALAIGRKGVSPVDVQIDFKTAVDINRQRARRLYHELVSTIVRIAKTS